jgi:hypothetical protein
LCIHALRDERFVSNLSQGQRLLVLRKDKQRDNSTPKAENARDVLNPPRCRGRGVLNHWSPRRLLVMHRATDAQLKLPK